MKASSITARTLARLDFRAWAWWQIPGIIPRFYVAAVPAVSGTSFGFIAVQTSWRAADLGKFFVLVACGLISVAATPRTAYTQGTLTRDFTSAWVLPVAVLLPPVYALMAPIPLLVLTQRRIHRGVVYRRVFTAGAMGLAYAGASELFRAFPASFAGSRIGTGGHAVTWAIVVIACEVVGGHGHNAIIAVAVKLANPATRLMDQELGRDALLGDLAEFNLGVLITVLVATSPAFCVFAVLMWLMVRRYMTHTLLLAKSRIDTKTGLLNASTWEAEAATEIARSAAANIPVCVALIDIDHFKRVNDTHGHLAGDRALKAISEEIREHLRSADVPGRFGGEEFVVLLPDATEADALRVAERLRAHVEATPIPIGEDPADASTCVRLTISVGVAALDKGCQGLTDLMAAADVALYYVKQTGRNKAHAMNAPEQTRKIITTAPAD